MVKIFGESRWSVVSSVVFWRVLGVSSVLWRVLGVLIWSVLATRSVQVCVFLLHVINYVEMDIKDIMSTTILIIYRVIHVTLMNVFRKYL